MNHSTYGYAMEPPIANRSAPAPPTPRRHATLAEHPIVQQLQSSLPALALGAAAVGWLLLALEKRKNAHLKRQLRAALEAGRAARRCVGGRIALPSSSWNRCASPLSRRPWCREARVARRMEFRVDVEEHEAPVEAQEETVKQAVEEMEAKVSPASRLRPHRCPRCKCSVGPTGASRRRRRPETRSCPPPLLFLLQAAHEEQELAAQEDQLRKLQEELHELKVDIQEVSRTSLAPSPGCRRPLPRRPLPPPPLTVRRPTP